MRAALADEAVDWRGGAICTVDSHTEISRPDATAAREAAHICLHHCPVYLACWADALANLPAQGILQAGQMTAHHGSGRKAARLVQIEPLEPCGPYCKTMRGI